MESWRISASGITSDKAKNFAVPPTFRHRKECMPKLQILLRKEYRKPEGIAAVNQIVSGLGIRPTGTGFASLSGEISQQAFESMFSSSERTGSPQPMTTEPGSAGSSEYRELPVPEALKDYVESITVAPPHVYFNQ